MLGNSIGGTRRRRPARAVRLGIADSDACGWGPGARVRMPRSPASGARAGVAGVGVTSFARAPSDMMAGQPRVRERQDSIYTRAASSRAQLLKGRTGVSGRHQSSGRFFAQERRRRRERETMSSGKILTNRRQPAQYSARRHDDRRRHLRRPLSESVETAGLEIGLSAPSCRTSSHHGRRNGWFNVSAYKCGVMGFRTPNIDRIGRVARSSPTGTASRAAPPAAPPSSPASRRSAPA